MNLFTAPGRRLPLASAVIRLLRTSRVNSRPGSAAEPGTVALPQERRPRPYRRGPSTPPAAGTPPVAAPLAAAPHLAAPHVAAPHVAAPGDDAGARDSAMAGLDHYDFRAELPLT